MERFDEIIKSEEDKREYRGLKLENSLTVLLISDPSTEKSAAGLRIKVGHMCDPDEIPGLAHFCDHMLYLGSEKYPCEDEFSNYINENGGDYNGTSSCDMTKFYFDVIPDKLERALDIFVNCFICPLFSEAVIDREVNVINSEHETNSTIDDWRINQIGESLSDPKHPYNKFGTGNLKTLVEDPKANGIDIRSELIKFHKKWYSANIMSLAVYGKETLDELEEMVVSKFSNVENNNVEAPIWPDHPYLSGATKTHIVPLHDCRSLILQFPTSDLDEHYKSAPEKYLSHLIGHEGKGSIIAELKAKDLCASINAIHISEGRGFGFFYIRTELTDDGMENIDEIIKIIFQYLNMLKDQGSQKWLFDENCNISENQFRSWNKQSALSVVRYIVHAMQIFPLQEVLSAPYLVTEWNPKLIDELLNNLSTDWFRVTIVAKEFESICEETETWYGTKYHTEKISDDILQSWKDSGLNTNLHLPEPNIFIPTNFDVIPIEPPILNNPFIISDSPVMRVWFKQDTEFLIPKTLMNFDFASPIVYADPVNYNLTKLFAELLNDSLSETLFIAELADLKFNFEDSPYAISLSINGYSHKQKELLEIILNGMFSFEVQPKRFAHFKEKLHKLLSNFKSDEPYEYADSYLPLILKEIEWSNEELLDSMSLVTIERLEAFVKEFLARIHVECLIYGNVDKEKTLELTNLIEEKLNLTNSVTLPLLSTQLQLRREVKLVNGESYLFEAETELHKCSCVQLYLQCGMQDDQSNILINLAAHIFTEPALKVLRVTEQLGYDVICSSIKSNGLEGIRFMVQSNKNPIFVEERIEAFIESMEIVFDEMTSDEFHANIEAVIEKRSAKPEDLSAQFNAFLNEIKLQQYHFDRANSEVEFLRSLTKQQFIDYYKEFIKCDGSSRQALFIHILSTAKGGAGHADTDDVKPDKNAQHIEIKELSIFKSSKELYPLVQPYYTQPKGGKSKF